MGVRAYTPNSYDGFTLNVQLYPSSVGSSGRDKVLDEVSTAVHGGAAAVNEKLSRAAFYVR
ncbi:hypothetical protein DO021_01650 [Desulfobacter hydrogenophilus]|uniref:Uncharacterized protein n=1 Tax=Desulfobacter hydrogenophilus TaxID=2291 RepID=A0A328FKM8_9BACT|nr:hypothetical protein [Desulfobacter hydrogenophilus]NDY71837.1 hypothetical protein [Desulfobacter hydrogenophilus]QBH13533.1 hypothetical protein EYB58_11720 [Desulfobacter hydrogenophilus]RAM03783.1 hypothetical protein DO021_01650 [Desulfobacter hydrogenophilus]